MLIHKNKPWRCKLGHQTPRRSPKVTARPEGSVPLNGRSQTATVGMKAFTDMSLLWGDWTTNMKKPFASFPRHLRSGIGSAERKAPLRLLADAGGYGFRSAVWQPSPTCGNLAEPKGKDAAHQMPSLFHPLPSANTAFLLFICLPHILDLCLTRGFSSHQRICQYGLAYRAVLL